MLISVSNPLLCVIYFDVIVIKCPSKYSVYATSNFIDQEETDEYFTRDSDDELETEECDDDDQDDCSSYLDQIQVE